MVNRKNVLPLILSALLTSGLILFFHRTSFFRQIELATVDKRFQYRPADDTDNPLVHVDIDDASIETIGRWPWPRKEHARIVETLRELGAKSIVFDVIFPDEQSRNLNNQFVNQYDRMVNRYFDGLFEHQQNLKNIHDNWRNRDRIKPDDLDVLKRNLKKNKLLLNKRKKRLKQTFETNLINQDRMFARSLREAGNVIGGFVIRDASYKSRNDLIRSLANNPEERASISDALDLIHSNFLMGTQALSEQVDLSPSRVHELYEPLKKWVASEVVDEYMSSTDSPDLSSLIEKLQIPEESREESILRRAYNRKTANRYIENRYGLSLDGPFPRSDEMVPPIPELARSMAGFGHVSVQGSPLDGTMRHAPLIRSSGGKEYVMLGLAAVLYHMDISPSELTVDGQHLVVPTDPPTRIPINNQGKTLLNWENTDWVNYQGTHLSIKALYDLSALHTRVDQSFQTLKEYQISGLDELLKTREKRRRRVDPENTVRDVEREIFSRVDAKLKELSTQEKRAREGGATRVADSLKSNRENLKETRETIRAMIQKRDVKRKELKKRIEGKTCLIGSTHTGSTDIKPTPVDPDFPQVATHSTVFDMVYNREFLRTVPAWIDVIAIILAAFLGAAIPSPGTVKRSVAIVLVTGLLYAGVNQLLFQNGMLVNFSGVVAALFLSFTGVTTYNLLTVESQRRRTKKLFERYVDYSVVEEIMQNPERVEMGGTRERLTIVFMDLAGFTSLSEHSAPEQVVDLISTFLAEMTDIIFEYRGTIDKYEGDALMAYWGAPIELEHPERNACRAMLECQERIPEMNRKIKRELPELSTDRPDILNVRIGVNTGDVVMGNVGSRQHADFTVLGDDVNLAARLETANKFFGTSIMISEETYRPVQEDMEVRKLGQVIVKGRHEPVRTYELVGQRGDLSEDQRTFLSLYERGWKAFLQRNWETARDRFQECLELRADDYCEFLIDRIDAFKEEPPEEDVDLIDLS